MALLSLNDYLIKLKQMLQVSGAISTGDVEGWKTPRQIPGDSKKLDLATKYANLSRTSRDHVLTSIDITTEVLCELPSANGGALKSLNYAKVWFSDGVGRELNDELEVVLSVLSSAFTAIEEREAGMNHPAKSYLLHVNDLDRQSMSVRPSEKNYAYMGSQMSIISPSGHVYHFTIDRSYRAQDQKYAWTAMVIPKEYVLCQFEYDDGRIVPMPADGHIDTIIGRIAFFIDSTFHFDRTSNQLHEYGYMLDPTKPAPVATPFTTATQPVGFTMPEEIGMVLDGAPAK